MAINAEELAIEGGRKVGFRVVVRGEFIVHGVDEIDARREIAKRVEREPYLLDMVSIERVTT